RGAATLISGCPSQGARRSSAAPRGLGHPQDARQLAVAGDAAIKTSNPWIEREDQGVLPDLIPSWIPIFIGHRSLFPSCPWSWSRISFFFRLHAVIARFQCLVSSFLGPISRKPRSLVILSKVSRTDVFPSPSKVGPR